MRTRRRSVALAETERRESTVGRACPKAFGPYLYHSGCCEYAQDFHPHGLILIHPYSSPSFSIFPGNSKTVGHAKHGERSRGNGLAGEEILAAAAEDDDDEKKKSLGYDASFPTGSGASSGRWSRLHPTNFRGSAAPPDIALDYSAHSVLTTPSHRSQ